MNRFRRETIAFAVVCAAFAAKAEDGCSKDTDCKGERICVQHACVEPPDDVSEQTGTGAAPATYRPAPGPVTNAPVEAPPRGIPAPRTDTVHRHLGGFIRPDLGFGYASMSASQNGTDASIGGLAGTFGFAAGGALSENSILAFHLWDLVVTNPDVTINNSTFNNANATLTIIALGPEYTAYFSNNAYFSITPSLSRATLATSGNSADTNWGFGLRAAIGKEWWVGDHWGLGVVGHISFSVNEDAGSNPPTWSGWGATVAFSATYN